MGQMVVPLQPRPSPAAEGGAGASGFDATEGTRNETLNRAAWSVFRLDGIDLVTASDTLLTAVLHVGLSEHEGARTIASALQARRA